MKLNMLSSMNLIVVLMLMVAMPIASAEEVGDDADEVEMDDTNNTVDIVNESEVIRSTLEARYEIVSYGYEKALAAMGAVIDYLDEQGIGTENLTVIRDNFTALYAGLEDYVEAVDPSGFGKHVAEMHKVAAEFKRETAHIIPPGKIVSARKRMHENINMTEKEERMIRIRERIIEKRRITYTKICNLNVRKIKRFIERVEMRNITIPDDMYNLTDAIAGKCEDINITVNATELREKIKELKDELIDLRHNITEIARSVNVRAMEKAVEVVERLENKGMNVSKIKEKLEIVKSIREEVRSACINLTGEECREKIKELKEEIGTIGSEIRVIAKENRAKVRPIRPEKPEK